MRVIQDYTGAKARSVSFQWDTSKYAANHHIPLPYPYSPAPYAICSPPQDSGAMTIFTENPETYNWHRVGTGYGNQCLTAIEDYPVDGFITIDCDQGDCPEPPAETPDGK